jgi:hypothetical protein
MRFDRREHTNPLFKRFSRIQAKVFAVGLHRRHRPHNQGILGLEQRPLSRNAISICQ